MFYRIILNIMLIMLIFHGFPVNAGGRSGLSVPRFVSLKSDEVNVRTGPGTRYPISWVYRRSGMPVEVIEEFDMWRRISDADGTVGWVHKTMLEGRRNVIVKGKKPQIVKADRDKNAKSLLKIEPTVIMRLLECTKTWCRIQISGYKGWIEKKLIWGVYQDEVIE